MASPDPTSSAQGETTSGTTTHTLTLPVFSTGDLLIVFFSANSDNTATWPVSPAWVEEFDEILESDAANGACAYREVDGTEGWAGDGTDTITVTTLLSRLASWVILRITGQVAVATTAPEFATNVLTTDDSPNPPSLTPAGGSDDYLFIAFSMNDIDVTTDAFPTSYDLINLNMAGTGGGSSTGVATAARKLTTGAAQDPAVFTLSAAEQWLAGHLVIYPAGAAPDVGLPPPYRQVMPRQSRSSRESQVFG